MTTSPPSLAQLQRWLEDSEDEHLEFKEAKQQFDSEKLSKYCVALANEGGGHIILGVTDKLPRRVVGTKTYTDIAALKRDQGQRVGLRIDADEFAHPDGRVLVVSVPSRPIGMPIEYRGAYWMRRGEDLVPMSPDVLRRIFAEGQPDYTAEMCTKAAFDDLDPEAIEKLRAVWVKASDNEQLNNVAPAQLLEDAELTVDGQVTYAALILLGTHRALGRHLAQAETIFEYRSSEGSLGAQQRVEFRQGFLLYLDKLWELINLRNDAYQFHDGLFVRSIRCFNEKAVREALLNALAHRDYRHGGSIFVRQFPKHMEISSPGGFPSGINAENLIYQQNPRNRRIAETLRRCNLVERAGQGADLLFRTCVKESKPLPDYSASDDYGVNLVLAAGTLDEPFLRFFERVGDARLATLSTDDFLLLDAVHRELKLTPRLRARLPNMVGRGFVKETENGPMLTEGSQEGVHDAHTGGYEGVHDAQMGDHDGRTGVHEPLLAIERRLLLLALGEPQSAPAFLQGLGYSSRTRNFRTALDGLLERGLLERTIPDKPRSKNQRYRLTDLGRERLDSEEPHGEG